ncbi:MAG: hypothetical protein Q8930_03465 [Bacillota bacterium]|nr:hypothetical protein [Bacillota bacterium]
MKTVDKNVSFMLKQTFIFDCLIGVIAGVSLEFFVRGSGVFIVTGVVTAYANFIINSIIGHLAFNKLSGLSALIYVTSYFIRIILTALIGFVIFTYNKYGTLEYILGYTLHFMSLAIYSFRIKNE